MYLLLIGSCLLAAGASPSMDYDTYVESLPDAAMGVETIIPEMWDWVEQSFTGQRPAGNSDRVELRLIRQDHNNLRFGQSCMETPVVIGGKTFTHGLGTHANSEIRVTVPAGAALFRAQAGIDNNFSTQGKNGTVVFIVEVDGREAFRSPVLRGGQDGVSVEVPVAGVKELTLKVDTTDDGPSCDQSDWADAAFIMEDGKTRWLDDYQNSLLFQTPVPPFSFVYGGKSSAEFLNTWPRAVEVVSDTATAKVAKIAWTDPATQLRVAATVTLYKTYPACDWVVSFENAGSADTPILEDIQAMDTLLATGLFSNPTVLHELQGDACGESTFLPRRTALDPGASVFRAPTGGRSSSISAFPFFDVEYQGQGIMAGIGWTGQWAMHLDRTSTGPTRLRAGMEQTHLLLHPGESIRTPRILLYAWKGNRSNAHNGFRRLMLWHYSTQSDGKPSRLPVVLQTYDRYNSRPEWVSEAGQIKAVETAHALGCESYWLDAAWFPGNFPNGVGNWFCKPAEFPNGLKPVSDRCHELGMKFVLWFEPERVAVNTQIANEHPEFVHGGKNGGLFKLDDPAARAWLTDLLSTRISEYGIDIYRNDFNMDPLDFWRRNDAPDRQGMTEIRYIEGLYQMWDELRQRHPGLLIDNCSSGGRRIDIEMCKRSYPLWRSDTNCFSGHPEWKQAQSMTITQYVPLQTACVWSPDSYDFRSAGTGGLLCQLDYLAPQYPLDKAKGLVAEIVENRKYWYGDFYPMTSATTDPSQVVAWQFHRPDLDAGIVLAFRRVEANLAGIIAGVQGCNPDQDYEVEFIDGAGNRKTDIRKGSDLAAGLELRITAQNDSLLVRYKAVR